MDNPRRVVEISSALLEIDPLGQLPYSNTLEGAPSTNRESRARLLSVFEYGPIAQLVRAAAS